MSAFARISSMLAALAGVALLAGCERPPVDSVQYGYRGTGMVQVYNPRAMAEQIPLNQPPARTATDLRRWPEGQGRVQERAGAR